MSALEKAIEVSQKWRRHRDDVKRFFEVTRKFGHDRNEWEQAYIERMKLIQKIIKAKSEQMNTTTIETVMAMCKAETDMMANAQILAAGYELASGTDFTI